MISDRVTWYFLAVVLRLTGQARECMEYTVNNLQTADSDLPPPPAFALKFLSQSCNMKIHFGQQWQQKVKEYMMASHHESEASSSSEEGTNKEEVKESKEAEVKESKEESDEEESKERDKESKGVKKELNEDLCALLPQI